MFELVSIHYDLSFHKDFIKTQLQNYIFSPESPKRLNLLYQFWQFL